MTTRCGGGTSGANPAYTAVVDLTVQGIAAVLATKGLQWILPALPLLNLAPLTLSSFCATDPPAMPTLTTAEVTALLGLQFGADFDSGLVKTQDAVLALMWDQLCVCTSGSLTAPPTLSQPSNTPVPVPPPAILYTPCDTFTYTSTTAGAGTVNRGGGTIPIGLNATSIQYHIVASTSGGGAANHSWRFEQVSSTNATLRTDTITVNSNPSVTIDTQVPFTPGTVTIRLTQIQNSGGSQFVTNSRHDTWCNGQLPNGVQQPCCPPDAATAAQLDLILRMVTLIQRQSAPFAYVYGTNHTGLSGHGSFAVSGLIGVSVDITTLPTSYGRSVGSPEHLYDVGFVTLGTADGYETSHPITSDGALLLPPQAGAFTAVGYTLAPGVVVSIRELVREP